MTRQQARARVAELEQEVEQLSAIHYDIELEIEELDAKLIRFRRRWKELLPPETA